MALSDISWLTVGELSGRLTLNPTWRRVPATSPPFPTALSVHSSPRPSSCAPLPLPRPLPVEKGRERRTMKEIRNKIQSFYISVGETVEMTEQHPCLDHLFCSPSLFCIYLKLLSIQSPSGQSNGRNDLTPDGAFGNRKTPDRGSSSQWPAAQP